MQPDDHVFIFSGPRGSGKTTALVAWAREDVENRVILVASEQERHHVLQVLPKVCLATERWPSVQTVASLFHNHHPKHNWALGIDNYDRFPPQVSVDPNYVAAVTYTSDEYRNVPFAPIPLEDVITGLQKIVSDLR